jgi:hypothetical protein
MALTHTAALLTVTPIVRMLRSLPRPCARVLAARDMQAQSAPSTACPTPIDAQDVPRANA